jgi:hypothetical protein
MDTVVTPEPINWPAPRRLVLRSTAQGMGSRLEALRLERNEFMEEWRDITDNMNTMRGRYLLSENRKHRRSKTVLNEKGIFASRTCGAGMLSGISSPSRPWISVGTQDSDLNEWAEVKRWCDIVEKMLYRVFSVSNYYQSKQAGYRDQGDFGQGPMIIDQDFEDAISCYNSPPGEYLLSVNHKGFVDTLFREKRWTVKDIVGKFGSYGHIPREIRDAYDRADYDAMFDVVPVVQPNLKMIKNQRGPLGMPFMSVYYCPGLADDNDNNVLAVSGYHENPISAPRWDVQPGDIYSSGHPGSVALSVVKSLQVLERRKGQIIDKLTTPPSQAPSSLKRDVISHMPGAINFVPDNQLASTGGGIRPLYEVHPQALTALAAETRELENRTDVAYYIDLFLATINSDRRQVTAREIAEVHEEKLLALSPVLERNHYEGLNFEIRRVLGILTRAKVLPPPPEVMGGMQLKITYTSILAVAQRLVGASSIERFAGFMGNLAAGDPKIMDKWDTDQTVDEYADALGVAASIVRSDEEVAKLREARAQQEQAAQALTTANVTAQTAKVLSEADTGRSSNLLADIIGGQGQVL